MVSKVNCSLESKIAYKLIKLVAILNLCALQHYAASCDQYQHSPVATKKAVSEH
jgi:hypothetical protein